MPRMKLWGWFVIVLPMLAGACTTTDSPMTPGQPSAAGATLVRTDQEPPGVHCADGGIAVSWGIDDDSNGVLGTDEVDHTEYHCNPAASAPGPTPHVLVKTAAEPRGPHCANGGSVVRAGLDADASGTLDDSEATETTYVCESDDAPPPVVSRVDHVGPGAACAFGGTAVYSGRDADKDGALGTAEIESSAFVCDEATASDEVEVGTGYFHSCARKANGTVWCWGYNVLGQLGISSFSTPRGAVPIVGVTAATALGVGSDHACAVVDGGAVWCWGNNGLWQLGDASAGHAARAVAGIPPMVDVVGGGGHTCGLTLDHTVWCWGSDYYGESGHGATTDRVAPAEVPGLTDVLAVSAGGSRTCVLRQGGEVLCWGAEIVGPGDGEMCDGYPCHRTPTLVTGLPPVTSIASAATHTCAITVDRQLWCWGMNYQGVLGDGTEEDRPTPAPVGGIDDVREIAVGGSHSCAIRGDESLWCWGSNAFGQLAVGSVGPPETRPVHLVGNYGLTGMSLGEYHGCALRDGAPRCWGLNDEGEVGPVGQPTPVEVLVDVQDFSAGNHGACAVLPGGQVWCWGAFDYGEQRGIWDPTPTPKLGLPPAKSVAAGATHACIAAIDGSVWCWGGNDAGELGDPTRGASMVPLRVPLIDDAVAIYAGGSQSCAQRADGSLWCWGTTGVLFGSGRPPTQILPTVTSVALGNLHGCAVDAAHVAWCWGNNEQHQVSNSFSDVLPVTQQLSNVAAVVAGYDSSCAQQLDGNLWCWGDYRVDRKLTPVGDFTAIESSYWHTCMIRPDTTVACYGFNSHGQLGDGTYDYHTTPVAVTGLADVVQLSAGYEQTCARRRDNSLWCWGSNDADQLGLGGETGRVTVPTIVDL